MFGEDGEKIRNKMLSSTLGSQYIVPKKEKPRSIKTKVLFKDMEVNNKIGERGKKNSFCRSGNESGGYTELLFLKTNLYFTL